MTKMASIAINSKNLKIFSRTKRPVILKLDMKHQAMELYKVYINHDLGMTLTFLQQGQLRPPMHLNGKKIGKCHFMANSLLGMSKWTGHLC